jgi:hypothetical protein
MNAQTMKRTRGLGRKALIAVAACLALAAVAAPGASANLEFQHVGVDLTETPLMNPETGEYPAFGPFSRQAGAHPDLSFSFALPVDPNIEIGGQKTAGPHESVHAVELDLPPGFTGNPTGIATCTPQKLASPGKGGAECPVASQVGFAEAITATTGGSVFFKVGVFNIAHGPDVPALFGFNYEGAVALIGARVRPGDYGISSGSAAIPQAVPVESVKTVFWGVPADPSHDLLRQGPFSNGIDGSFPISAEAPRVPFLTSPTSCTDTPVPFTARGDSWEHRGIFDERTLTGDEDGTPFVFEGCEKLPFNPTVDVRPLSKVADAPTGLNVDVDVPQSDNPNSLATAHVRKIVTKFPAGVSVSPGSAAGLGACSLSQIDLTTIAAPTCPNSSKIARVTIDTPLLEEPLSGDMILATPYDNPFGSLIAVYVSVKGPGFNIKLPGKVDLDPLTGQLTATFDSSPQQPFSHLHVEFPGGSQASLATAPKCGTYSSEAELTSWASVIPVSLTSPMTFNEGCTTGPNAPSFTAGTNNPQAGKYSPFEFHLTRGDRTPYLSGVSTTLPGGLLANIGSVEKCGDAAAAAGTCPAASEVGSTTVLSGPGAAPLSVKGHVYLTGPYKGAPYGLSIAVPTAGQAGPFDLGVVVVRAAIYVDPEDAHVSVVSDPLPTIIKGVPLRMRQVNVAIDKPDFTLNPTNCSQKSVLGSFQALGAPTSNQAVKFRASACGELGFKPSLALSLKGGTSRSQHPALKAILTARKGDANIARTVVALPHSEFLAQNHIRTVCTRVQFNAGAGNGAGCPKASIYGEASATTPLLDKPLSGPVYLRSSSHPLPDLVAALHGPIEVNLVGRIDSKDGGIRTTFASVPDAPVSRFVLTMQGGKKGLLENSRNLCASRNRADVGFTGQNGKEADSSPVLGNGCSGKAKKKAARAKQRRG